ncbi:MAG TPA: hypothetical protein VGN72_20290 [Tepidisphaeraceae bacterium]|jgi:hypothetical protein|nr:hypothetical protein [Tepidisphaeraceae bacterium]
MKGTSAFAIATTSTGLLCAVAHGQTDHRNNAPPPAPAPAVAATTQAAFPAPAPPTDVSVLGLGIQRTMRLLATSTPERRNRVRILFYGQSITEQDWSKQVADDLRARFPHADLTIENRAIGGFASQLLVRSAEHDLYPFYPDLVIFHVYGGQDTYEQIIRETRARTTAEVLIQTDHVTKWPDPTATQQSDTGAWWDQLMNGHFLPATANKYGCGLVDVRTAWLDYLRANDLQPSALLSDAVHLNAHGNYLLAELISRHLVYRPDLPPPADQQQPVRDVEIGQDVRWERGKLVLEFEGNRVDVITAPASAAEVTEHRSAPVDVLIDGRKPSSYPECYRFSRPSPQPWSPLFIKRIDRETPLIPERWTYTVTTVESDSKSWSFRVDGSVTGPDGIGESGKPFKSNSGRVRIDPADYFRGFNAPLPEGFTITWSALPMFVDQYAPFSDGEAAAGQITTLVQGLPNGKHVLTLTAAAANDDKVPPIAALRIYRPAPAHE